MITATLKNAPFSAYKGRLIVDMIRGLNVEEAVNKLRFTEKVSSKTVKKLLESAIANAEHNENLDIENLKVFEVYVDEGDTLKRFKARAKGRANHIKKRNCNITIKLNL